MIQYARKFFCLGVRMSKKTCVYIHNAVDEYIFELVL